MKFKNASTILELKESYAIIQSLGLIYPNFYDWFWNKIIPGVHLNNSSVINLIKNNEIIGVSIIKNSDEKKIRAIRIKPEYQNKGYGLYLIDESLKQLNFDKPVCSVSESMINDYSRIFINRYNFNVSHVYKGLYFKNKLEYEFNGNSKLKHKTEY